jgi:hypothetical protein
MEEPRYTDDGIGCDPGMIEADGLDLPALGLPVEEIGMIFPAFAGILTVANLLALYESYRKTLGLTGHIAEIGVLRASFSLFFARLTKVFEPRAGTIVHGFRGVLEAAVKRGRRLGARRENGANGRGNGPEEREAEEIHRTVLGLVADQDLGDDVHLHGIDVTRDLDAFFAERPGIEFKLVFLDVSDVEATRACLPRFWPRLVTGGVLVLDKSARDESADGIAVVRELLPNVPIRSYGFTDRPSAYVVKPGRTTEVIDVA